MAKPTTKRYNLAKIGLPATKDRAGADLVMTLPAADLIGTVRKPNPEPAKPARKSRGKPKWIAQAEEDFEPWSGYQGFVVRTVLLRAQEYEKVSIAPPAIRSADDIARLCRWLRIAPQEHVCVICLGINNDVLALHDTTAGTSSSSQLEANQVARTALLVGSTSVVLVHNHPSGNMTPSEADMQLTKKLKERLRCFGIDLVDHVIIAGHAGYTSFLERGIL